MSIKSNIKVFHNRSHIPIWNRERETCAVVEITYSADVDITKNEQGPLVHIM